MLRLYFRLLAFPLILIAGLLFSGCGYSPTDKSSSSVLQSRAEIKPQEQALFDAIDSNNGPEAEKLILQWKNILNRKHPQKGYPLNYALEIKRPQIALLFLEHGAPLSTAGAYQRTPLHLAAILNNPLLIKKMLQMKAFINPVDARGYTPLDTALEMQYKDAARLLKKHGAKTSTSPEQSLRKAVDTGDESGFETLLSKTPDLLNIRDCRGRGLLHRAFLNRQYKIARLILHRSPSPDEADDDGVTPLMPASSDAENPLIDELLSKGANPASKDKKGNTPLHYAAGAKGTGPVKKLLEAGAPAGARNFQQKTPLEICIEKNNPEVALYLLKQKASIEGGCPLVLSAKIPVPSLTLKLIDSGVPVDQETSSGRTALMEASASGNFKTARLLIQKGADVNRKDDYGKSPLHLAVENNRPALVKLLINNGAKPDIIDNRRRTPLFYGRLYGNEGVSAILKQAGAREPEPFHLFMASMTKKNLPILKDLCKKYPQAINLIDSSGNTLLHYAASGRTAEAVKILIDSGATVNVGSIPSGAAPLHLSVYYGNYETCALLIKNGAEVNAEDAEGITPLHIAARRKNPEMARLLIENGASADIRNKKGETPAGQEKKDNLSSGARFIKKFEFAGMQPFEKELFRAIQQRNDQLAAMLISNNPSLCKSQNSSAVTPMHMASYFNCGETVKTLIKHGVSVNVKDIDLTTPLHGASVSGNTDITSLLLKNGANVNSADKSGNTPIHFAAGLKDPSCALLLVNNGADINAKNMALFTPLHMCVPRGSVKLAEVLIKKGASPDFPGNGGLTALHLASARGRVDLLTLFINHWANMEALSEKGIRPLHLSVINGRYDAAACLLKYGAIVDEETLTGETALHQACIRGYHDIALLLLKHGADPNKKNREGLTPLLLAAGHNHPLCGQAAAEWGGDLKATDRQKNTALHLSAASGNLSMARVLIDTGADVKAKNTDGETPLYKAAECGKLRIAEILIKKGADVNTPDNRGITPLHIAAGNGDEKMVQALIDGKADLNPADEEGYTPLHWAASGGRKKGASLMLESGADVNPLSLKCKTPLDLAETTKNKEITAILKKKKGLRASDIIFAAIEKKDIEKIRTILRKCHSGAGITDGRTGETPLHRAAQEGKTDIMEILLESRADPNARDKKGRTPLHFGARGGSEKAVKLLIDKGVNIRLKDYDGNTPLSIAVKYRHEGVRRILEEKIKKTEVTP